MWQEKENGFILSVRVLPNAKRSGIEGVWNESAVKIALRAPAVDGQANKALIAFLADLFQIKKRDISILSGETSREKKLCFQNADFEKIKEILLKQLQTKR